MNRLPAVLLCGLCVLGAAAAQTSNGENSRAAERLKFVLVLTRHGVRSPTWTNERLDEYSRQPWPKWPVAPGLLTARGKQLMSLFGGYYRESFARQGLLSATGCGDAGGVYIDSDSDERTVETGRGLAEGMFPGCPIAVHALSAGVQDSLFHPVNRAAAAESEVALPALSGRIGNDPAALLKAYETPLDKMQAVLLACGKSPCDASGRKDLLAVKPLLASGTGDHLVELKGPLPTAATFAENFQLEFLEGMPDEMVGWGRADEKTIRDLMTLHAASSDLVQRTPYIARVQASDLLTHIALTIRQAARQKPVAGAIGELDEKVVFLVGHDTNISNIAALLDAHWLVNGYQRDDAVPGGALVFELWTQQGHADRVRVYYIAQSPPQMRNASPLSAASPPSKAEIFLPGCSKAAEGSPCDWPEFESMIDGRVDHPTAVKK